MWEWANRVDVKAKTKGEGMSLAFMSELEENSLHVTGLPPVLYFSTRMSLDCKQIEICDTATKRKRKKEDKNFLKTLEL